MYRFWGRVLVFISRFRGGIYYTGFFVMKMRENFVGTWETARNREVLVFEEV